jgi:hypothetical protein
MIPKAFERKMAEANGIEFFNQISIPTVDLNKEFLYKFIDIPNVEEIGQQIWQNIPVELKTTQYRTTEPSHYEKLKILVDSVETIHPWKDIIGIGLIITKPNSIVPIHTDHNLHMYALNIPIYNTSKPTTWFFKSKEGCDPWYALQSHGDPFNYHFLGDVEFLECFPLVKPAIFNTQVPHAIINNTNDFRCVLSFRFTSPFDFEKIKDKFINDINLDIDTELIRKDIVKMFLP